MAFVRYVWFPFVMALTLAFVGIVAGCSLMIHVLSWRLNGLEGVELRRVQELLLPKASGFGAMLGNMPQHDILLVTIDWYGITSPKLLDLAVLFGRRLTLKTILYRAASLPTTQQLGSTAAGAKPIACSSRRSHADPHCGSFSFLRKR